ncbi:catalase family protein [Pseudoalteromonas sp. T1lg48]|uniref:catalase family protein n=1 Tax=Pseudoalteromonas sp. T1lg48 TaxID=2077100 RepID=UPI000CF72BDF|nr:catalase family protein [Pseudoalteromonas sp. T1lg48]
MKKLIVFCTIGLLALVAVLFVINQDKKQSSLGIVIPADEQTHIADIISSAVQMVDRSQAATAPSPYRRDVHAKAHGCVKATFSVPALSDARLRHGIFAEPSQYQAWVRFSSGDTRPQADGVKDARGMAIKVMGVDGKKLLPLEQDAQTQDFVMINSDVFFIKDVAEYAKFMQYQAQGSKFGYFFNDFNWNIFKWHLRSLYLGAKTLKPAPDSLLTEQYHSLSAYRLGAEQFMKYSAKACSSNTAVAVSHDNANFLRQELSANLSQTGACFDFMVQLQNPDKYMPVEDTTVKWQPEDSPFIKVARIEIPEQQFDTQEQNQFCENLSFTPWHAVKELEPVGGINRLRKAVYNGVSRYRHDKNGQPMLEPSGWCLKLDGSECSVE